MSSRSRVRRFHQPHFSNSHRQIGCSGASSSPLSESPFRIPPLIASIKFHVMSSAKESDVLSGIVASISVDVVTVHGWRFAVFMLASAQLAVEPIGSLSPRAVRLGWAVFA
jgi:hypothetical protein